MRNLLKKLNVKSLKMINHQIRHLFCRKIYEKTDADLLMTSTYMRHYSLDITEKYLRRSSLEINQHLDNNQKKIKIVSSKGIHLNLLSKI